MNITLITSALRKVILLGLGIAPLYAVCQDAFLTNAYMPLFVKASTDIPISVRVRNAATAQLITFRVDWRWNNGPVQAGFSQTTTGITGNQFWPYEHPAPFNVPQGSGILKVWAVGVGEANPSNDTLIFRITALEQWTTKSVLLEQWTGTWCPQCPPANTAGNTLDNDPQVVVAKHHAVDEFSSGASTAFFAPYEVTFTPAGVLDQGEYGTYAPNPGSAQWGQQVEQRKQGVSPVQVGIGAVYNALDRMLTVDMSATYTYGLPGEHAMNVFILEDGISAPQANAPANYVHQQVVRDVLTGVQGDGNVIPSTPVPGAAYTGTWGFIVPEDWVAQNIRAIGFVTHRENGEATTLNVRSTSSLVVGLNERDARSTTMRAYPNPASGALWLELAEVQGATTLLVLAADGREVISHAALFAGAPLVVNGFEALTPGVYLVKVVHGDRQHQLRVVKE
ncbi:MAG: Omp28-related outer membrane protein [Flavobacteriales bacterium]